MLETEVTSEPSQLNESFPIPNDRFPFVLLTLGLLTVTLWGVAEAKPFLIPLTISGVLAFLLAPAVHWLNRKRSPEWLTLLISTLLLILPLAGGAYLLIRQAQSLVHDFPSLLQQLRGNLTTISQSELGTRLHLDRFLNVNQMIARLGGELGRGFGLFLAGLSAILDMGSQLVLILLYTILMIGSRKHLRKSSEAVLALHAEFEGPQFLDEVTSLIARFLTARLLIVFLVGAADAAITALFGLPYSFLLGTWLGIMTLIPAIGFIIGVIPPLVLAIGNHFSAGVLLALFAVLLVVSAIEGNVLTPKLVGRRLNINTLSTFVGLFAGGLLWGAWGMFLSIPVLGVLRICLGASPRLAPWGEFLAERDDRIERRRLYRQRRHWTL